MSRRWLLMSVLLIRIVVNAVWVYSSSLVQGKVTMVLVNG
ncbi:hypothetical protein SLEP1_g9525 [Rubroshorea leprosula]|uniref:Uncharacterized protein n=1 Tax=Rubroshorea leprosula TaxID=152421 RepID=A0AAV5IF36_9ROSI|nr:hypothetical protein SLEP1_g9525 [Rubroshorea leprosula]